jgi:hypothetical protein
MATKSHQLQIRVTPDEKSAIRRLAHAAGLDVSSYVLSRALPAVQGRFDGLLRALARSHGRSYVLADLNDFLSALSGPELAEAVGLVEWAVLEALPDYERNYVAAMVELACARRDRPPPAWTAAGPAAGAAAVRHGAEECAAPTCCAPRPCRSSDGTSSSTPRSETACERVAHGA